MLDNLCLTVLVLEPSKKPNEAIRARQGKKIRDFRKFRNLSQAAVAEAVGVTKAAVSEWEGGKSSPRPQFQIDLARALGVPWSSIFGLDGESAA